MKVLVIGGTRGIGREVVLAAHAAGHELTLLARNAERIRLAVTGVRVVAGDAGDADDIERAVAGQHAVVWTVGIGPTRKPVDLFSRGTRFLLAAMNQHGVRRLVCVTGVGAGDSRGHGGFLYDRILQPLLLKTVYEDKDRQEALLRGSDIDWTIVRPGTLTNGPATGLARALTDLDGVTAGSVSRADVAAFIVEHLETAEFRGTAVLLTR
jgi:putative NADH-flavin reductase